MACLAFLGCCCSSMDAPRVTLKTLDNYPRVLFWSIDEFLCFALPVFVGICLGSVLIGLSGALLKPLYGRFKRKLTRGALSRWIYWSFPGSVLKKMGMIQTLPPSHQREILL